MSPTIFSGCVPKWRRATASLAPFGIFSIIGTIATAVYLLGLNLVRSLVMNRWVFDPAPAKP
jgi:hypothetical protein